MARRKQHFQWTEEDGETEPIGERRDRTAARIERDALLNMARRLEAMPAGALRRLPLGDTLIEAILHMASLGPQSAHRRQMLLVQKLLRTADLEAIEARLAGVDPDAPRIRAAERWRSALLEGGDEALRDYLEAHPDVDRQRLRSLIRQAGKPGTAAKGAARKLFQLIKGAVPVGEE
jgi:ribosome-associated protein